MISVIIPIYKVEAYIAKCIHSVIAQKNVAIDIVLVDDCTTDDSLKIACDILYNANVDYQCVRHEKNKGLSAARNSGISVANGEYIYFLDSDDELADDTSLSFLYKEAKSSGADCIVGNHLFIHPDYKYLSEQFSKRRFYSKEESLRAFCRTMIPIIACNKLVRKDFLISNDLYFAEGVLHEDQLWSFQMALTHPSVLITGRLTYLCKIRSTSIMQSQTTLQDTYNIHKLQVCSYLNSSVKDVRECKAVNYYLSSFAWMCYKQLVSVNGSISLYKGIRENQLRHTGVLGRCQLRELHLNFPPRIGYLLLKLMVKLLTRKKT